MAMLESQLSASKVARDAAKVSFDARLAQVRLDLEARGVAGRIADEVADRAMLILDEAADVVEEHPTVIGGTIVALMLWILRNPIIGWLEVLLEPRR